MGVNYARVHAAMTAAGKRLPEIERRRLTLLRARGDLPPLHDTQHVCMCGAPAVGRFIQGWRCEQHAPMRVRRDRCVAPLRCYCSKHLGGVTIDTTEAREQLAHVVDERTNELKHEIMRLASLRTPFSIGELAEFLPPAKSPARRDAEAWVRSVLQLAVEKGVVSSHEDRLWKGTR